MRQTFQFGQFQITHSGSIICHFAFSWNDGIIIFKGSTVIVDMPNEIAIEHDNMIASEFDVPELYEISFDLKLTAVNTGSWKSIIHEM